MRAISLLVFCSVVLVSFPPDRRASSCDLPLAYETFDDARAGTDDDMNDRATPVEDYGALEGVIDTSHGQIVIEFLPNEAPRHVEYFIKQAREGAFDGTAFHQIVKFALIQGGDPLSRNARDKARFGTGGLNAGLPDEVKAKHLPGAVSAVLQAVAIGSTDVKSGTSGQQFFIVLNAGTAQERLNAKFSVFAHVVEGMDVAAAISSAPATPAGVANERIIINKVTIREKKPSVDEMKAMKVAMETSLGTIKLQLMPESAPNTTRSFVRYVKSGMYDGTTFYRVSQKYFMEVGYLGDWPADSPNRKRIFATWPVAFEKNDVKNVRGTVSMRQTPVGFSSWYFFVISKDNPALDGLHTPFAKVTEGLDVLEKIQDVEVDGDKPKQRIEVKKITIQ